MFLLPDYCQIAPQLTPCSGTTFRQDSIFLKSFPGQTLTLPSGSYFFAANPNLYQSLDRNDVLNYAINYLKTALVNLDLWNDLESEPPRLLLVLPDKTRTAIATHLLLDAVCALKQEYERLQFSILFGLGTHPPMTKASLINLLGKERYQILELLHIPLRQQTTVAPVMPQAQIKVRDMVTIADISAHSFAVFNTFIDQLQQSLQLAITANQRGDLNTNFLLKKNIDDAHFCTNYEQNKQNQTAPVATNVSEQFRDNDEYTLSVPLDLWQHHLTIVAGDTELHPYEGRGGSGGIHKMLVVGLANIQAICRTHSTKILLDTQTRAGQGLNTFVQSLDYLANCLKKALVADPHSLARTYPLGFSIVSLKGKSINGFWFGQEEECRQRLTAIAKESRTVILPEKVHIVVADTEPKKGTDILAGARALQYLSEWDSEDNPLLADTPRQRVALLFNSCHEKQNNHGIGTKGTKAQLDVLGKLVQAKIPQLKQELSLYSNLDQALGILRNHRREILISWTRHLQLISEMDDFLVMVKNSVLTIQELLELGLNTTETTDFLQATLATYANSYSEQGKSIQKLLDIYSAGESANLNSTILTKITALQAYYQRSDGLGEVVQRALRCLSLLHKFETFLLATNNPNVLHYFDKLDPDLSIFLPAALQSNFNQNNLRFSLLGLIGINLNHYSPQQCLQLAIAYVHQYNPHPQNLKIAFLQEPLIVHHSSTVADPAE